MIVLPSKQMSPPPNQLPQRRDRLRRPMTTCGASFDRLSVADDPGVTPYDRGYKPYKSDPELTMVRNHKW